jgi:site-specific recombinase XerD
MELMYRAGLRVGETVQLGIRDVQWNDHRIRLRSETTKGKKAGAAYTTPELERRLQDWIRVRPRGGTHLLTTLRGGPISRQYVWQMLQRYARRAGLETHVHPHMLRHTFATEALGDGMSVAKVQQLLRHSDVRTTSVYLHLADSDLQREMWERQ